MPKIVSVPKALKPYQFHGVNIDYNEGEKEAVGQCPWCSREGKFSVNVESGQWRCFVCAEGTDKGGGNIDTFLKLLWEASDKNTNGSLPPLAEDRKLLYPETLMYWGVVKSSLTGEWLLPGYNVDRKLKQLYKYVKMGDSYLLLPTPELGHQLHLPTIYDERKPNVVITEGPWDGMILWELLRCSKRTEEGYVLTANEANSLYASTNIVAIPGCGSVGTPLEKLLPLFAGKVVTLMFDSDHHVTNNGKSTLGAGYGASKRATALLAKAEEPPAEIHWLKWGEEGYDPSKKSGYDIRDWFSIQNTPTGRVALLQPLLNKLSPIPQDWVVGRSKMSEAKGKTEIDIKPCNSWKVLVNSWRKAMRWTDGLDRALSVMLACVTSTKAVGDQLWCKIMGPAASGKSTLCEALSVNKKYVLAKSTIRGFHSGFKTDRNGSEDNSLVAQLYDKTLVTKDGDTLLQSPNLSQILSEARDLYDSTSRTHYRNKMSKDYQGVRMTWLLCGTSSLRSIDSSELGERFLDCVIMESIDDDLEDEILWRVANRTTRGMSFESDGKMETQHDPDLVKSMQLTGGYVNYLRLNARELLASVNFSDTSLQKCVQLGKFIAYMRARPSIKQDESAEREFATRLVSQMTRLSQCMAVVLNKKEIDKEVMRRVGSVALDTSRGRVLELAKWLHRSGREGTEVRALSLQTNQTEEKERVLLRFMRRIGVAETYVKKAESGVTSRPKWRLTERLRDLYSKVITEKVEERI